MKLKLPSRHLLVFAVRYKKKFKGIWTPQAQSFADFYDMATVWIADMAPDCRCVAEGVGLGARCLLKDVFELESLPAYIAEMYAPHVDFNADILKEVDEQGGAIEANVIHENSLLAVTEDTWKKVPRLSWESLGLGRGSLPERELLGSESALSVSS